jgi:flagellar basal body P-ring formation protein FlgA
MIRLIIILIYKIMMMLTKVLVLGVSAVLLPLLFIYMGRLNAEPLHNTDMSDPLEGYSIVKMQPEPDMITIPVPVQSIRKGTLISQSDLVLKDISSTGVNDMISQDMMQLIGQEARQTLYKDKPILLRDIGAMTIVRRNDTVTMLFQQGAMTLQTVGRAMADGGAGDTIKVMNEQSKKIVTGRITKNGEVDVSI